MSDSLLWSIVLAASVIVLFVSMRRAFRRPETGPTLPRPVVIDDSLHARVSQLVADGKTIEAIKALRDGTGLGLREAKERVDAWDPTAGPAVTRDPGAELVALEVEARAVLAERGAIHAIKLVRERTSWGLADAKGYVDRLGPH